MRTENETLRVAVLTRTGRLSGRRMAEAIEHSPHALCGVLAEKRTSMIRKILSRKSFSDLLRQHGVLFLLKRLWPSALTRGPKIARMRAPYHVVHSLNSDEAVATLERWKPDLLVVANAPLLKPSTFQVARLGAVNFHSGRLPEYGGLASEFWALYDGQEEAYATIHTVAEQLDSGGILEETTVPIASDDTPDTLHEKLVELGTQLILQVLDGFAAGSCPVQRNPGPARLCPWPTPEQRRSLRRRP